MGRSGRRLRGAGRRVGRVVGEENAARIVRIVRVARVVRVGRVEKVARAGKVGSAVRRILILVVRMGEAVRTRAHTPVVRRLSRAVTASDWR